MFNYLLSWFKSNQTQQIAKSIIGKTIVEAKKMYPDYRFQHYIDRGYNEVYYHKHINYASTLDGKITRVMSFG
jgi:hypothetical protein